MAARSVGMTNSATLHPSDEDIIKFINDNIENEDVLTAYFSTLTKPLSASILTMKLPWHVDGDDGEEEYNFLGYASYTGAKYFKHLVRLATPEAIDAALSEDPINTKSGTTLHAILLKQAKNKKEGVVELIQKASPAVISAVLIKQCAGTTPLFLALQGAEENVICELIKKANDESINNAARMMYFGLNILEWIINLGECSQTAINTFLARLHPETMDFLMSMQGVGGLTPFKQLMQADKVDERNDLLVCALISHTSITAINALAKQKYFHDMIDLLTLLMIKERSQVVVDVILSRLDKDTLDELVLKSGLLGMSPIFLAGIHDGTNFLGLPPSDITKQTNKTALAVVRHLSKETLIHVMKQPVNLDALLKVFNTKGKKISASKLVDGMDKIQKEFLDSLSKNNAPLFNEFVRKMLVDGDRVDLSVKAMYRLDAHNLSRYLAQHPETSVAELKQARAYSRIINWRYKQGFDVRLQEGEALLQKEMVFSLTVYRYLKDTHLVEPLALIVIGYFERDQAIINRFNFEVIKEKHPTEIAELKRAYPDVKQFFPHDKELKFKYDEASIILGYLADHENMVNIAVEDFKRGKPKLALTDASKNKQNKDSKEPKKEKTPSTKFTFSLFGRRKEKEEKSKILDHQEKLDLAKKSIDNFVQEHNRSLEAKQKNTPLAGTAPKTLADFKKYFQEKENKPCLTKIEELEKNMNEASAVYLQECVKLIMVKWGNIQEKAPKTTAKKVSQAQQLIVEAKSFGYECKDMKHDGNCFFHAIADQLALQRLSHLGTDHEAVRAKAMAYILEHIGEYKNFLAEHDGDINNFIGRNIDTGTWADHLVISALSRALNVNIVIVRSDGAAPNIFKQRAPIGTLYVGNEVGQHYQSLIENRGITRTRSLQTFIDAAPVDLVPQAVVVTEAPVARMSIRTV